jgi:protein SCO1/2/putative membrane protein
MKRVGALALVAVLCGGAAQAQENDTLRQPLGTVPDFRLTDQHGNVVTREHLQGKVCVISFFFSCCGTVCPVVQKSSMARLHQTFADSSDVMLVSINVFPSHDTQTVLTDYAGKLHADPDHWLFLRGEEKEIHDLVTLGFKLSLVKNDPGSKNYEGNEVFHPPFLLVVDHRGVIRGYVDGTKDTEVDRAADYIWRLVQAKYFPAVNASLNGLCGLLLVAGFVLIRVRRVLAHKVVMLAALATSALFLGCYLYYHFVVLENAQPTQFAGAGPIRIVYLAILISHTLLAAAVAPMALRVTYLGLRNRLARHTILARVTLPLWLYVSVTGVVVYVMLYHLYPPV